MHTPKYLLFSFLVCSPVTLAYSCTTIAISPPQHMLVAKNLDWEVNRAAIFINHKGAEKTAILIPNGSKALKWNAHFSSITFSHKGLGFATEGLNEVGLSVDTMQLKESVYPPATDSLPAAPPNQWVQYILDTSGSVEEAIHNARETRIVGGKRDSHYLVCDPSASCATFEYLNGKLVVHSGKDLPYRVLANSSYEDSKNYLDGIITKNGQTEALSGVSPKSLDRFARAALWSAKANASQSADSDPVKFAFEALTSVAQSNTQWSIVFDLKEKHVYFHTLKNKSIRSIDLTKLLSHDCHSPIQMLDVETPFPDNVTSRFTPFSAVQNNAIGIANPLLTEEMRDAIAHYPEHGMKCIAKNR